MKVCSPDTLSGNGQWSRIRSAVSRCRLDIISNYTTSAIAIRHSSIYCIETQYLSRLSRVFEPLNAHRHTMTRLIELSINSSRSNEKNSPMRKFRSEKRRRALTATTRSHRFCRDDRFRGFEPSNFATVQRDIIARYRCAVSLRRFCAHRFSLRDLYYK